MEQRLRLISKYCWYIIIALSIFLIYRLPHRGDYLYNERTIFANIQVADSTLEILEVDFNGHSIFKSPSPTYKINVDDGSTLFDRGDSRAYNKQANLELAYYSFEEDIIYDAKLSQTIIDEIDREIKKTKAKSRYFRFYYYIHADGKIELNVMEEYHGADNNKNDVFIYSCSYQANRISITHALRKDLDKYFYISTAD